MERAKKGRHMSKTEINEIEVNGVAYVRKDGASAGPHIPGKRAVVFVDRGWAFAGDVEEKDGRILLSRAADEWGL